MAEPKTDQTAQPGVIGSSYTKEQREMVSRISNSLHGITRGMMQYYSAAKTEADQTNYLKLFRGGIQTTLVGDESRASLLSSLDLFGGAGKHASETVDNFNRIAALEGKILFPIIGHALGRYEVLRENFTPELTHYVADYATRRYHDLFAEHAARTAATPSAQKQQQAGWFAPLWAIGDFFSAVFRYAVDWMNGSLGTRTFWKDYYETKREDTARKSEVEQVREVAVALRKELQELELHGRNGQKLGAHVAQLITGVDHNGQFVSMPLFVDPANKTLAADIDKFRANETPTIPDAVQDIIKRASQSDEQALKMLAGGATAMVLTTMVANRTVVPVAKIAIGTLEGITRELGKGYTGALGGRKLAQAALETDPRFREAKGLLLSERPDFEHILKSTPHQARIIAEQKLKEIGHAPISASRGFGHFFGSTATKFAKVLGPLGLGLTAWSYAHAEERILKADDLNDSQRAELLKIARIQSGSEIFSILSDPAMAAYKKWFVDPALAEKMDKYIDKTIVEAVASASPYATQYASYERAAQHIERYASPAALMDRYYEGRNVGMSISSDAIRQVAAIWKDYPSRKPEDFEKGLGEIASLIRQRFDQSNNRNPFGHYLKELADGKAAHEATAIEHSSKYNPDGAQVRHPVISEAVFYHDLHNQGMLYARYLKRAVEGGQGLAQFERETQTALNAMVGYYASGHDAVHNTRRRIAILGPGMLSSASGSLVAPPEKTEIERQRKLDGYGDQPGYIGDMSGMMTTHLLDLYKAKYDYEASHFETSLYKSGTVPLAIARSALQINPKTGKPNNEPFAEWLKESGVEDKFKSLLRAEEDAQKGKAGVVLPVDSEAHLLVLAYMYEAQNNDKWKSRTQQHREQTLKDALDLHTKTSEILAIFMARPDAVKNSFRLAYMMADVDEEKVTDFNTKLLVRRSKDLVAKFEAARGIAHAQGLKQEHIAFYQAFKAFGDAVQQANVVTRSAALEAVPQTTTRMAGLSEDEMLAAMTAIKQGVRSSAPAETLDQKDEMQTRQGGVFAKVAEVRLGATGVRHIEPKDASDVIATPSVSGGVAAPSVVVGAVIIG